MKEFILGLLTKTLNRSDEEISELLYQKTDDGEALKEDALDVALNLFEQKVTKIKDDAKVDEKKLRDEGYKRAQKEVMGTFEAELKEKYDLDTDLTGAELVEEVISKFKKEDSELTPDKIKLTDTYRNREKELKKEARDQLKERDAEIETLKVDFEKQQVWGGVSQKILTRLDAANPAKPKNQDAAANLTRLFVDSFKDYDWQKDGEGYLPVKEGKRLEDNLGNEVSFETLVDERIPQYFDIPKQDGKGSAGNNTGGGAVDGVPSTFKDDKDYLAYVNNEPDPQKRIAAKEVWDSQQK